MPVNEMFYPVLVRGAFFVMQHAQMSVIAKSTVTRFSFFCRLFKATAGLYKIQNHQNST